MYSDELLIGTKRLAHRFLVRGKVHIDAHSVYDTPYIAKNGAKIKVTPERVWDAIEHARHAPSESLQSGGV